VCMYVGLCVVCMSLCVSVCVSVCVECNVNAQNKRGPDAKS